MLNVGGSSKKVAIPAHYEGWRHLVLDVDATRGADIVCDARSLQTLPPARFDAVYCSHNLEHYFRHDVPRVLAGFLHVLKPDGFAEVRVPDLASVFRKVLEDGVDLEDALYVAPAGPVSALDIIYGFGAEIERSGRDFFAHKTGFTAASLTATLRRAGFGEVWMAPPLGDYEVRAVAFRVPSDQAQRKLLGIPLDAPGA
ncbi:MAG: methyltransferase domain-containing protein [Burkholderiales bacterium]|nr:methyltransferase domain-containing protein [Burkholderiales bacterium]